MSDRSIPQHLAISVFKRALDNSLSVESKLIFFSSALGMGNNSGKLFFLTHFRPMFHLGSWFLQVKCLKNTYGRVTF